MALPRPTRPEYSTTIPSSGKKIKYQPFTVKEEKVLVLASEGKDNDEIANAVGNCIKNCVSSPSDLNVDELSLFDIEFLFLKLRAKSVGEKITVICKDPSDLSFSKEVDINVDKIGVKKNKEHSKQIKLDDDMTLVMNYPGLRFFAAGLDLNDPEGITGMITECFGQLIVGDEVYNRDDLSAEEIQEWVDGLSSAHFNRIQQFFLTMPKLSHTVTLKNTNSGENFSIVLEGLADFF